MAPLAEKRVLWRREWERGWWTNKICRAITLDQCKDEIRRRNETARPAVDDRSNRATKHFGTGEV
jgi:hypothetical protein